ncbi:hypothetical protein OHB41_43075 [Streptomyces sp. NBC_01571]|uniref:hypothetical protein n=1 Tax=Streptomyces sp. NBC_01571 TaxID=2975883 RepID=UPI00224D9897|nr:hypothetical protein [Streptomyces sp. NBC_01571]MCX4579841.1 hypothetical protein [Streptomyces sp. NBC_01571]
MNIRVAEKTHDPDHPNSWKLKDDYWIGDETDHRTFIIYVYELPKAAGDILRQWSYPNHFEKEHPGWQTTLAGALADGRGGVARRPGGRGGGVRGPGVR